MTRIAEIADRLRRLAKRREDEGIYTDSSLCAEAAELLDTHTNSTPANPIPPGWPDPLESPQAEAIRNGKLDDTEIRNLFDCMERELRLHRERAANPAQVTASDWNRVDSDGSILLYTVRQDGWRKGEPVMVNEVTVHIEAANGSQTPINPIADRILSALSQPNPADERAVEALREAADRFDEIRVILIDHLDEPERNAFWKAVNGREFCRHALATEDRKNG